MCSPPEQAARMSTSTLRALNTLEKSDESRHDLDHESYSISALAHERGRLSILPGSLPGIIFQTKASLWSIAYNYYYTLLAIESLSVYMARCS